MPLQLPNLPNFNVNTPQMPSALDTYGKMLQLRSLQGEQQLQPLRMQQAEQQVQAQTLENQQRQLEMESQQAMRKAWSDPNFLKSFTGNDKAEASGLGFDPDGLTKTLISQGVLPKDAIAMTQSFIERSQKIATTQKDIAQTGEANAAQRDKGMKILADKIGGVLDLPAAKAADALAQLKQDMVKNPKAYAGVPQEDLAHLYGADLEHLPAMATLIGLDSKIADFHKSKSEAASAAQKVVPDDGSLSVDSQQAVKKDVAVAKATQPLKIATVTAEANARQQAAQGDPNDAGKLLADGSLTLADLKTRGSTPKFIEQATMSAQKIKPTYNPADEVIAEQVAKSPSANQFFGSANSLIQKGGTLDQLEELGKKIPQHDFPALNTIDDWQKLARGKGPLAGYAAMALGAADDYGKVMGGGTASDHARDAALDLFSKAASPEMRAQAVAATRGAVQSQRDSRIGNNQFLKRQYGVEVGGTKEAGAVPKSLSAEQITAYATAHGVSEDEVKRQAKAKGIQVP
jgi:hypothetical protein